MSFVTANNHDTFPSVPVMINKLTEENIDEFSAIDINIVKKKPFLEQSHGPCEGFGLWTYDGKPAAYAWLMYRNGKVSRFIFKNIDAWIFAVFVGEEYRRKGLCEYMMNNLLHYLHTEKKIERAYLEVRKNNFPARLAYKKIGGTEEFEVKLFRFCKIPFPLMPTII